MARCARFADCGATVHQLEPPTMSEPTHRPSLLASLADIPETNLVPVRFLSGGSIGAQIAYGRESSLMIATRQPQYHSKPHRHDAEQLNYVLQGELYVFVEDDGFLAREGDIFRIPRNAVHWSWVQGNKSCILLETHTPPLIGDPGVTDTAVALIGETESNDGIASVESQSPAAFDQAAVERKVMPATATEAASRAAQASTR
jgi:mannose-6-phosphate isomerase-like protein (cupin superfamily)